MKNRNTLTRSTTVLIERQLKVLGHAFTALSITIIVVTLGVGIFSYLNIQGMEQKVATSIADAESRIEKLEQKFEGKSDKLELKMSQTSGELKAEVQGSIGEMEERFSDITGAATKPAEIKIMFGGKEIDENTIIPVGELVQMYVKNVGGKTCSYLSYKMYLPTGLDTGDGFYRFNSDIGIYSSVHSQSIAESKVDPSETFHLFRSLDSIYPKNNSKGNFKVYLKVYYGSENGPAEVEFLVSVS